MIATLNAIRPPPTTSTAMSNDKPTITRRSGIAAGADDDTKSDNYIEDMGKTRGKALVWL